MTRHIVHMDLDTFFVSVERLQNSSLNGKPIIIGGSSDRGVVAACSYEARQFGVYSGMPFKLAIRLCPHAIVIKPDIDIYSKQSRIVTDIISERAPIVEKASIDEHYIDVTGLDKYFGCYKWTDELSEHVTKQTGLPISFGLSVNKTVSKIATSEGKPKGKLEVSDGTEKNFLAPLSIRKIPGVGDKKYYPLLRNMGIDRIGTIQEMPLELMRRVLQEEGVNIWNKANGIDDRPVVPYREQDSISTERTFGSQDTIDMVLLRRTLVTMIDGLGFDLREMGKLTSCVTVKIKYTNMDTEQKQRKVPYTANDKFLVETTLALFEKLYTRRMMVRLVGVKFSGLVHGNYQINLFDNTQEEVRLYEALDDIKKRFGSKAVMKAISVGKNAR